MYRSNENNKIKISKGTYYGKQKSYEKNPFYCSNDQKIEYSNKLNRRLKKFILLRHGSSWTLSPNKFWQRSLRWQFNRLYSRVYIVILHINLKRSFFLIQICSQTAIIVHNFLIFFKYYIGSYNFSKKTRFVSETQ